MLSLLVFQIFFSRNSNYFQGLFQREDYQSAVKIPLGIIPAGSGNGLARSLAHINKEKYDKGNHVHLGGGGGG